MKNKGMTLVELIIASVILMTVAGALLLVFSSSMQEYTLKSQVSDTLKNNFIALNKIIEEVRTAEAIYCPGVSSRTAMEVCGAHIEDGFTPLDRTNCVAFNVKIDNENRVIGYYLSTGENKIKRVIFDQTATEDPSTWTVSDPLRQITKLAYIKDADRFSYYKFTLKFDKGYLQNHPLIAYPSQILIVSIVLKRLKGAENIGYYPLTVKAYLERNGKILP